MAGKQVKELEFERTDGDQDLWPPNTKKLVDSEGHVNYMQSVEIDEEWAIRWRKSVASALAVHMKLPTGPEYILKSWPEGYHMFIHHKGPQDNPRTDKYLFGAKSVPRFRSIAEFIPHALWLMTDPSLTRSNCHCKYCSRTPQRNITESFGLSTRGSPAPSASQSRHSVLRPPTKRERKPREKVELAAKPFAAIRRAPKPVKISTGPKQSVSKDRSNDLRATFPPGSSTLKRWYREGELLWCKLNSPITPHGGNENSSIIFWPGIIREFKLGHDATPRSSQPNTTGDEDIDMDGIAAHILFSSTNDNNVPWTVRQWIIYKVALLSVPLTYDITEDQVLPYQAYAPNNELLEALRSEPQASDSSEGDFVPFMIKSPELGQSHEAESGLKFKAAAAPYTLAIQISASLATYWTATDDWEFKFSIPPAIAPEAPSEQTLHSAIAASMSNNHGESISVPPRRTTGPIRNISRDKLNSITERLLGSQPAASSVAQSFTEKRYQGLWWGTERIWTDELVRLKVARKQVAPDGADQILPPAEPSKSALAAAANSGRSTELKELGAGGRGVFMKLESLFVVDLPQEDGSRSNQLRASGMLYELVDADWEGEGIDQQSGNGKGRERVQDGMDFVFSGIGESSSFNLMNLDPALQKPASSLATRLLPNPDPSVPISATTSDVLSKTLPNSVPLKSRSPNTQLSNPGMNCLLPAPPKGFKFRAILPPGHEAVISLTLISGRYYPGLLLNPLMRPYIEKAFETGIDSTALDKCNHLWALEGLAPGFHNSVDPAIWKKSRQDMVIAADQDANVLIDAYYQQQREGGEIEVKQEKETSGDVDVEMQSPEV